MINNQIKIIKYEYKEVNEKYSIEFSDLTLPYTTIICI